MLTAWDGHVRVNYLPRVHRLRVIVLTIERTLLRRLHDGLACEFVINDPAGPPTFVDLDLADGMTDDIRALLGGQIARLAEAVLSDPSLGHGPVSRSGRLNLLDMETLARTWAPYRDHVLNARAETRPSLGSWAGELWTLFRDSALAAALRAGPVDAPALNAREVDQSGDESEWRHFDLPAGLADIATVEPRVEWTVYDREGERRLTVRATAAAGGATRPRLLVGLDAPRAEWVPLVADPEVDGRLTGNVPLRGDAADAALRFRTDTEET